MSYNNKTKCEWCEEGVCTYYTSLEDQYESESPMSTCDGSSEQMVDCGMIDEDD